MSSLAQRRRGLPLASMMGRYGGAAWATLCLAAVTTASGVALLGVSGWFLTGAALSTAGIAFNLFGPSALVRMLSFIRILSRYGEKLIGHDVTLRLVNDVRDWTFRRLIPVVPLPPTVWRHGDLVSRLMADADALQGILISVIGPAFAAIASGVALWILLALTLPAAAPSFGAGFAVAAVLIPAAVAVASLRLGRQLVARRSALRSAVFDTLQGFADIAACDARAAATARAKGIAGSLADTGRLQALVAAAGSAAISLAAGGTMLAVLWIGCDAVGKGDIGGPLLVGLLLAVMACFEGPSALVRAAGTLGAALSAKARIELITAAPSIRAGARDRALPPGSDIILAGVAFAYRSDRVVLGGLDLTCAAGSRTAIVGESGCGKTTILRLILGLASPARGTVTLAGLSVGDVDPDELWRRVTLMDQSTPVFLGTIRENLLLGCPDASDDELWRALCSAGLATHVSSLPAQLETWCGEDGHTLSAGQARRLCLARALLAPAPILLLDEPTSGLDREAERDFLVDLPRATAGRTVLIATHAALPAGAVDRIVTLVDRRLEAGGGDDAPPHPSRTFSRDPARTLARPTMATCSGNA